MLEIVSVCKYYLHKVLVHANVDFHTMLKFIVCKYDFHTILKLSVCKYDLHTILKLHMEGDWVQKY